MKEHRQWLLARQFHQYRWHGSLSWGTATVFDLLARATRRAAQSLRGLRRVGRAGLRASTAARDCALRSRATAPIARWWRCRTASCTVSFWRARCLRQPRLLFIDDPSAGLDEHSRRRLLEILDELDAEGMGVVLATERESDLPAGITHVLRVEAGTIREVGNAPERSGRAQGCGLGARLLIPKVETRRLPSERSHSGDDRRDRPPRRGHSARRHHPARGPGRTLGAARSKRQRQVHLAQPALGRQSPGLCQ